MKKFTAYISLILLLLCIGGCNTYYTKTRKFNAHFAQGDLKDAEHDLLGDKKGPKRKTRVLYYLNLGAVNSLQGDYKASNDYFEQALNESEGIDKNYALAAASLLSNPNVVPYKGENFELLMVHFYKAINYLYLHDYDAALVECRRMDIKLGELRDKYKKDNRYKYDAFLHNLMGIIYEADHDYNNAFIAYRNAYNYYTDNYAKLYGINAPEQLKLDLLRTAYRTGLGSEVSYYEKQFGMHYKPEKDTSSGELVFFWMNGLGPVKDEWSINFEIIRGQNGYVTFVNSVYGLSFPFYYPEKDQQESGLGQLELVRLTMPRYLNRPEVFKNAKLRDSLGHVKNLEVAEDISQIAYQSLHDRMLRELGESMLRLATKKAAEYAVRQQNQDIGAAVGIINFITEQPDTRNWQTLPHSIYYSRMKLPAGNQKVSLQMSDPQTGQSHTEEFRFNIQANRTSFQHFQTMSAGPPMLYPGQQ